MPDIRFSLPPDYHKDLKRYALEEEIGVSIAARSIVRGFLDGKLTKANPPKKMNRSAHSTKRQRKAE